MFTPTHSLLTAEELERARRHEDMRTFHRVVTVQQRGLAEWWPENLPCANRCCRKALGKMWRQVDRLFR